jgi:hypothetical protein
MKKFRILVAGRLPDHEIILNPWGDGLGYSHSLLDPYSMEAYPGFPTLEAACEWLTNWYVQHYITDPWWTVTIVEVEAEVEALQTCK